MNFLPQKTSIKSWLKVAALQFNAQIGQKKRNLDLIEHLILSCKVGTSIVVLPEMCNTGYLFKGYQEVKKLAEICTGETFDFFSQLAKKLNCYIVYGYPERHLDLLYNSQNIVAPTGQLLGTYRKINLFAEEKSWATRGNYGYLSFDSEIGKIGLGICMDINFDNFTNFHKQNKSDIVAISSCWLEGKDSTIDYWINRWQNYSGLVIIANIHGSQDDKVFSGQSCIIENSKILAHCHPSQNMILETEHNIVVK